MLNPKRLYLGDNGRMFCGSDRCAGSSASHTGRDISGQTIHQMTPADLNEMARMIGREPTCEGCGREGSRLA